MSEKQETTTTKTTPKKATARKDDVVLFMGPYSGVQLKEYKTKDELVYDGSVGGLEYGSHRYARTERGENGYVVFEWRGPVDNG